MSKITNVKGRVDYISNPKRQEYLYAVYETMERSFWSKLATENQKEFQKSGTDGKCIEARELIIALPKELEQHNPNEVLAQMVNSFKEQYGVECIAALHHNKRKTNYHIHLIFSERKLLEKPVEKVATRNRFYNESGKCVRTKKEIINEDGLIRDGCRIIKKGEVYEQNYFTKKEAYFKSEAFLKEVKQKYTELINRFVQDEREKLKVFEQNGVYLATKKIGKNNPKAEQIKADNEARKEWNAVVDMALILEVEKEDLIALKRSEIIDKVKVSIKKEGFKPFLLAEIIWSAVRLLKSIIDRILAFDRDTFCKQNVDVAVREEVVIPEKPVMSGRAQDYRRLKEIKQRLESQSYAIHEKEMEKGYLESELKEAKGLFKGKERAKLKKQIEDVKRHIDNMRWRLRSIVKEFKYQSIEEFMEDYRKASVDMDTYEQALEEWDRVYGEECKGNEEVQVNNDSQENILVEHYDDYRIKGAR